MAFSACTPHKRFGILSFFFDGVPEPEKSVNISPGDSLLLVNIVADSLNAVLTESPTMYYHEPYQKKQCTKCHDQNSVGDLKYEEPQLCYSCHENFSTKYEKLHGPVDYGFCTVCHEPHMSENKSLQVDSGSALCSPCHISYEVSQPDTHVEVGDRLCRECHNPHGFNNISEENNQK